MSTLGKDWASERYQQYERAGLNPHMDHVPVKAPDWPMLTELATQTPGVGTEDMHHVDLSELDDWILYDPVDGDKCIQVKEPETIVFDLEEVR